MSGPASTTVDGVGQSALPARAEVARLSLAVRTARREAEDREERARQKAEQTDRASELLARQLGELVESRRRACERELAERRAAANDLAGPVAGHPLVRIAAPAEPATDEHPGGGAAEEALEAQPRSEETLPDVLPSSGPIEDNESAPGEVAPDQRPRFRVVNGDDLEPVAHPALAGLAPEPLPAPAKAQAAPGASGAQLARPLTVDADELRDIVHAAVMTGLREAIEQAVATMHVAPALARHLSPAGAARPVRLVEEVDDVVEVRLRQRLLHLDVLLPLVAAVIVVVIFFAWIG